MALAALIVSVVSALAGVGGFVLARSSARAAARSAEAAAVTARLDTDRRHSELTPRFRISCEPAGGPGGMPMVVALTGPPELQRLDELTVTIRDDHPWRAQGTQLAGGPTPEQVARQIWGLWRFIPGTGPGAGTSPEVTGADATGRATLTAGLPVGEQLPFFLEPIRPPSWSEWTTEGWEHAVGSRLRVQLDCRRDGWEPWSLPCEFEIVDGAGRTGIPPDNLAQDELASTQRAALEAAQRLREREQAESVNVTWDDVPGQPGQSVVVVVNKSPRPAFGVVVRSRVIQNPRSLLRAVQAGDWHPVEGGNLPNMSALKPGDRIESIRPGDTAVFVCGFPKTPAPYGSVYVRFTDAAGVHWQRDQDLHLERLNDRDW